MLHLSDDDTEKIHIGTQLHWKIYIDHKRPIINDFYFAACTLWPLSHKFQTEYSIH